MKRHLIFAFLLAIFLLQGTVAAIGYDPAPLAQDSGELTCQSGVQDESDTETADGLTVSPTIEELSDYVVLGLPDPSIQNLSANSATAPLLFLSIIPPATKPPPRA